MDELAQVLWIGGPPGAGKTTAARLLARRHGLRRFSSDTHTWVHRDRALAAGVDLPPRGPGNGYYDRGPMIIDDLRLLPRAPLIVAEGGPITPAMARPESQAVWLIPSKDVQVARLRIRHEREGVPELALPNWEPTSELVEQTAITTIDVDLLTVEETVTEIERVFAHRIDQGPTAQTLEENRRLLRDANRALVAQHTRFPAGRTTTRTFDCECANQSCTALPELEISAAEAAVASAPPSILASGH